MAGSWRDREGQQRLKDQASLITDRLADLLLEGAGPRLTLITCHVPIATFPVFSVLSHFISAFRSSLT